MEHSQQKDLVLCIELRDAVELIKAGLRELKRINGANDFYHLPMLILANGIERLMKVIICYHIISTTKAYPEEYPWPKGKGGHDLMYLLKIISGQCFSDEYLAKIPAARTDIGFIRTNRKTRKILKILSDFSMSDRYYNFMFIAGQKSETSESPEQIWKKFELSYVKDNARLLKQLGEPRGLDDIYDRIITEVIAGLERLLRALCRLFTIGGLGKKAKQASPIVYVFLTLHDDHLGKVEY